METLKTRLQQTLQNLPWQTETVSLLLDGINVKNLLHRFYTQQNQAKFEVLYLQTPFAKLYEVSPCLVKIDNTNNPHLIDYLNNLESDWGYLLVSNANWEEQVKHLRDLLTVQLPDSEEKVILKIADPLVAKSLFGLSEELGDTQLFGPFSQICTTDVIDNEINIYYRPIKEVRPLIPIHKLTETQNTALDKVEIKRANQRLYQHMQAYFPDFLAQYPEDDGKQIVNELIEQSSQAGYKSPMEQTYFLNIFGYLGKNALQDYPEVTKLVEKSTLESIREASILAETIKRIIS